MTLSGHDIKNDEDNGSLPTILLWDGAGGGGGGFRKYSACGFSYDDDDLIASHSCSRHNISGHESVKDAGKVLLTNRSRGGGGSVAGALAMIFLGGGEYGVGNGGLGECEKEEVLNRRQLRGGGGGTLKVCSCLLGGGGVCVRLMIFDFVRWADIVISLTKLIASLVTIFPIFPSDDGIEFSIISLLLIAASANETGVQV